MFSTAIPSALGKASPVKVGPVNLEISLFNCTHQKRIIWKTIFRPLKGAAPPNILHAIESDQVLLAHPPPETGAFLTSFLKGCQKVAQNAINERL